MSQMPVVSRGRLERKGGKGAPHHSEGTRLFVCPVPACVATKSQLPPEEFLLVCRRQDRIPKVVVSYTLCLYVCMHACDDAIMHVAHTHTHTHMHTHMHTHIHAYMHNIHTCMHTCLCSFACACVCAHLHDTWATYRPFAPIYQW
jgi:hypothetical protein